MRVLIAEDDAGVRSVLERGLTEEGYVCDVATQGDDALHLLRIYDYAAAVLDWRMPGLTGEEVAREARKLKIKTPILIGEHTRGLEPHVDLIVADATDYVRADPDYDCGISGVMKIAHAAEGFGLDVEIHAPGPAHRHCMAAIRNTNYYELGLVHPKVRSIRRPVYAR